VDRIVRGKRANSAIGTAAVTAVGDELGSQPRTRRVGRHALRACWSMGSGEPEVVSCPRSVAGGKRGILIQ